MDTFPNITPRYSTTKTTAKRNLIAGSLPDNQFKQVAIDGINTELESWGLEWVVDSTDALTIETFLEGKEGYQAFKWTPPDESSSIEFICKQWNKSIIFAGWFNITATFERFYTNDS